MVKFLEDELKTSETKHCETCNCPNRDLTVLAILPKKYSVATQTLTSQGDSSNSLCLRCNSNLNSPSRTNSPFMTKLVKSSDSVISETKSSVSDSTQNDKLFTPAKKDDIMVNPILGHHRLCDRAKVANSQLILTSPSPLKHDANAHFVAVADNAVKNVSSSSIDVKCKAAINSAPKPVEVSAKRIDICEPDLLILHSDDTQNDTDDNEEAINESTSLLGTLTVPSAGGVSSLLTPKSKSNSIANKLLLKSPELMGGAKPKTPESAVIKPPIVNLSLKQCSDQNQYDVDKKSESLRGPGNGSTNSLWSRTSSRDGSKIFENFNRNLIKTIKAENPKMKGPRICALRIQNGSNNIVLDKSLEGEPLPIPIVYTRRSRLLDEELDDDKEVTLAVEKVAISVQTESQTTLTLHDSGIKSCGGGTVNSSCANNNNNIIEDDGIKGRVIPTASSQPIKHRTSTSSVSSELDLRRQQLSRVAEWVQNNSKMNEMVKPHTASTSETDIDILSFDGSTANQCLGAAGAVVNRCSRGPILGNNNVSSGAATSMLHNTSELEEMTQVTTSGGATSKIFSNNHLHQQQLQPNNSNSNCSATINHDFAQSNKTSINLYKYFELYGGHEDDDDLLENENESYEDYDEDNSEKNLDDENQIDLAQMEYNVKQFLLKQSEWSIHNKLSTIGSGNGDGGGNGLTKSVPQRTETNL